MGRTRNPRYAGCGFYGTSDLRRILTDYAFKGFPLLKHFSVMGYFGKAYCLRLKLLSYYQSINLIMLKYN